MNNWNTLTAYCEGTSHLKRNLPCQDYGEQRELDDEIIIGALADGCGSAKHAEQGAQQAVRLALAHLENHLSQLKIFNRRNARTLFLKMVGRQRSWLKAQAEILNRNISDYACTLIAYAIGRDWMIAMQIGDGFIVTRFEGEADYRLLFTPRHGECVNETEFLTDSNAVRRMQTGYWQKTPAFLCGSTDGLEKLAINLKENIPHAPFFSVFDQAMQQEDYETEQAHIALLDFLQSDRVNAKVDDDKTLLLCSRTALKDEKNEDSV